MPCTQIIVLHAQKCPHQSKSEFTSLSSSFSSSSLISTLALATAPYSTLSFIISFAFSQSTHISSIINRTPTSGTNTVETYPVTPPQNFNAENNLSLLRIV